jgi:hypothetical protein
VASDGRPSELADFVAAIPTPWRESPRVGLQAFGSAARDIARVLVRGSTQRSAILQTKA